MVTGMWITGGGRGGPCRPQGAPVSYPAPPVFTVSSGRLGPQLEKVPLYRAPKTSMAFTWTKALLCIVYIDRGVMAKKMWMGWGGVNNPTWPSES